ncbi:MAG TPA: response regulator [Steroidobacteraceae bacterium]|nr:response regulator [Steroidobacteraceae bacterium]
MTTDPLPASILIVDDEAAHLKALCETLSIEGYKTTGTPSARSALDMLRAQPYDVLLTDLMMPEMNGIALLNAARGLSPGVACIVMTGHGTIDSAVEAMKGGAIDYVLKPIKLNALMQVIARGLEIRRLHRVIDQRTRELEQANKDLEAFSYSISHDLRAPLRVVDSFCQMFLEDYGETIPAEGRRMLERARAGSQRMSQLIDDLLAFARFGSRPLRTGAVDMQTLATHVAAAVRAQVQASERADAGAVTVEIGELPDCIGDSALLEQVLINLLSNGFKFTRGRPLPRVEVSATNDGSSNIYAVRDNGVGFDAAYAHKLFGVFQRLHSATEFEGTGIGLFIVKRIVQRHGGSVWAESTPGEGATFYFSLPAAN